MSSFISVSNVAAVSGTYPTTNKKLRTANPDKIKKVVPVPFLCLPTSPKATINIGNDIDNTIFIKLCNILAKEIASLRMFNGKVSFKMTKNKGPGPLSKAKINNIIIDNGMKCGNLVEPNSNA